MAGLRSLACGLALACAAPHALAQTGYTPPPPGTVLSYSVIDYEAGLDAYAFDTLVVASGPDFIITRTIDAEVDDPGYMVEFAGFLLLGCKYDVLPAEADRKRLLAMWPLGKGVAGTGHIDGVGTVTLEKPARAAIPGGKTVDGYTVSVQYDAIDEDYKEQLLIAPELGTPISVKGPSSLSVLKKITPPSGKAPQRPPLSQLGDCARLF
ncbi:MAG: hypothetical protein R3C52_04335 [Hyphomonadaceae bacterium]